MANPISKIVAYTLNKGASLKPYQKLESKINRITSDDIIAYTTIASVAAKDAVGCGMYVYQSLNNDKIPEKRRKFVSALDLTNGILMIVSQVAMFFAMRKINAKLFDKIFPSFRDGAYKLFGKQIRANGKKVKKPASELQLPDYSTIRNEHASMKNIAFSVFKSFTELAAATIVAKRIIVPFIATPLASKVEKLMDKYDAKKHGTQTDSTVDNSYPSMTGADRDNEVSLQENDGMTNLLDIYRKNHN
ncbi:hypothetical protein J6N69_04090 [bacterium]|nr:hypothetical protein [bacterium]